MSIILFTERWTEHLMQVPVPPQSPLQLSSMAGRECYHCKQRIEDGEQHDCWTTTEAALTQHLSDDLRDAWSGCMRLILQEFR
jgi:hypothetical protein